MANRFPCRGLPGMSLAVFLLPGLLSTSLLSTSHGQVPAASAAPESSAGSPPTTAPASTGAGITAAERRIFLDDHFANTPMPGTLTYRYQRSGTLESGWEDGVTVRARRVDGKVTADVDFLSGERRLQIPPADDMRGNPVILHFLERELREMNRLTRGSMSYYRKRIRMALAAGPAVRPIEVALAGARHRCGQVRIDPYVGDPAASRFEAWTDRYYMFTLCDDLPGAVARLEAVLPGRQGAADRLTDRLEWSGFEPGRP